MLRDLSDLFGYDVVAKDKSGEHIGDIHDIYFDDRTLDVRYVIVETGGWLDKRRTLVAPEAFAGDADWFSRTIPVSLTREQIENAPDIDLAKPVSRQHEVDLRNYYGWTPYWGVGMTPFGAVYPTSGQLETSRQEVREQQRTHSVAGSATIEDDGDPHLRSAREVIGYHIRATDGEIGHVEDFILDTEAWRLRYMIVDTKNWLPGKKVVVAPEWIEEVDYASREVRVDVPRARIEDAPEFDPTAPVNRAYEVRLYDYYGRPAYWDERGDASVL